MSAYAMALFAGVTGRPLTGEAAATVDVILDFLERVLASRLWDLLIVRLGVGGAVIGLLSVGWTWFGKRKNRGRDLVDQARPELAPIGNLSPRGQFCIRVQNRGPGRANNLRLRLTGTPEEAAGGEVAPGKMGETQSLDVSENPALHTLQPGPLALTIAYADKFGNDYAAIVPVTQIQTPGGLLGFDIQWTNYSETKPALGWRDYYRIGKR